MKQVLQYLGNGDIALEDVPTPKASAGSLLIGTRATLVSAGTERMLLDFGRASLVGKARQQPDRVREVLNKAKTDGVMTTVEAVRSKLDAPIAPGYCNVGVVNAAGDEAREFNVGDRVVSNGKHAEIVVVPQTLCARVPDAVSDEQAAFTVLGAVGLQGMRLANPTLGECVVVVGLGLVGLMTVQMLRAQGCRVLGIDLDPSRIALAQAFGAETVDVSKGEDPLAVAERFSRGRGVDAVLITASTKSNEPVSQAAKMCRKRGRIVLVGVIGLELSRADFFEKELTFQVSCSYGPGRYDPEYEEKGHDYPVGFVRWTEQRNFEAVLDLMASGAVDVSPLITHRVALEDAGQAYDLLSSGEPSLGILIEYGTRAPLDNDKTVMLAGTPSTFRKDQPVLGFIGAGNYASRMLMPAFRKAGAQLHTVVTSSGINAVISGKKLGFHQASTDVDAVFGNPEINTAVIVTQHDSHAELVCQALNRGKHVFVEKPLALNADELETVKAAWESNGEAAQTQLMVGFNRRFSPLTLSAKSALDSVRDPKTFILTMNAGAIPADHWTQDAKVGGGRIIGEACHYIDLLRFLVGYRITSVAAHSVQLDNGISDDKATITLSFADGSIGTIHYFANGHNGFPKERIEVFAGGRIIQIDNFRRLRGWGWKQLKNKTLWRQDKGQDACCSAFLAAVAGKTGPAIPVDELFEVADITLQAAAQLRA